MENQKRIKGSALIDQEGVFVFTPYHTGVSERSMQLLKAVPNAALWRGKQHFSVRFKWPLGQVPPLYQIMANLVEFYTLAIHDKTNK